MQEPNYTFRTPVAALVRMASGMGERRLDTCPQPCLPLIQIHPEIRSASSEYFLCNVSLQRAARADRLH
jgi:hypothetical protein